MRGFVALTDYEWYRYLEARPHLDEVNFWRPKPDTFAAIRPGEPFFFKLKAPRRAVCGFGQFSRFTRLPLWMAWEVFGEANGAATPDEFRSRIEGASSTARGFDLDRETGCISIAFPTFFMPDDWVDPPRDWPRTGTMRGRLYDLAAGEGRHLWDACVARATGETVESWMPASTEADRYGEPQIIRQRMGQGSFRLAVLDAYGQACAVTTEHSLPVLDAAHIKPYSVGGTHEVPNGLPLRRDLHRLFDLGFVTVKPDRTFAVSRHLRDDWANGRVYYELEGTKITEPSRPEHRPSRELLEWHGDMVFRA
jgi:putative restriction endonuclease